MLSNLNLTLNDIGRSLPLVAGLLALLAAHPMAANADDSSGASKDVYTWSAELVSLDEAAGAAVVKALVVSHADMDELSDLDEGDRVTITWSGFNWASGIRSIARGDESGSDRFMLPAEFVSSEKDGQYIVFKVPVPREHFAKISALSPGEWVTMTSPHRPSGRQEAVVDARPYNDVA